MELEFNKKKQKWSIANCLSDIAIIYKQRGETGQAINYHIQSLELRKQLQDSADIATSFLNIGDVYHQDEEFETAIKHFRKCYHYRKIMVENYSERDMAGILLAIGKLFFDQNDYDSSRVFCRRVKDHCIEGESFPTDGLPEYDQIQHPDILLDALTFESASLHAHIDNPQQKQHIAKLDSALQTGLKAIRLAELMRTHDFTSQDSKAKLRLIQRAMPLLERTLRIAYDLYELTQNIKFLEHAFYISEQNKSLLKYDRYKESIAWRSREQNNSDALKTENLEDGAGLINKIRLKIDEQTVFVEYFVSDTSLFVFAFGKHTEFLKRYNWKKNYKDYIYQFQHRQPYAEYFWPKANELYDVLLKDVRTKFDNPERLIIVPDGYLYYLPFEALVVKPDNSVENYRQLDYLVKHSEVYYAFSAALFWKEQLKDSAYVQQPARSILAFAPDFSGENDSLYCAIKRENCAGRVHCRNWMELPESQSRLGSIVSKLNFAAELFNGEGALEYKFMQKAANYSYIQLNTHGIMDSLNPGLSYLVFSQVPGCDSDSNDGFLHTFEIYDLKLNTELLVLTACKTGTGYIQSGEGPMSLSRAFSYAGCRNIMMSLWSIEDEAAIVLLQNFYEHLGKGYSRTAALQKAKLELIEGRGKEYNNPFHWAGMVLLEGNYQAVEPFPILPIMLIIAGVLLLFTYILYRLNQKK